MKSCVRNRTLCSYCEFHTRTCNFKTHFNILQRTNELKYVQVAILTCVVYSLINNKLHRLFCVKQKERVIVKMILGRTKEKVVISYL